MTLFATFFTIFATLFATLFATFPVVVWIDTAGCDDHDIGIATCAIAAGCEGRHGQKKEEDASEA